MFPKPRFPYRNSAVQFTVSCVLLTLLISFPKFVSGKAITQPSRIVALGDLHGDYQRAISILQSARIVDAEKRWVGGDTFLVLTGDFLDRGTDVIKVMNLLMELEKQAPKAGGRVLVLLGNHEMMNLIGDLRYVTPEIYATFADAKSEERQEQAYEGFLKTSQREAKKMGLPKPEDTPALRLEWMESHPVGYVEYREALGPKGKYGRWIRKLPVVVMLGDIIFVHGGIHPKLANYSLDEMNERIEKERKAFDSWVEFFADEGVFQSYYQVNDMITALKKRYDWLASSSPSQGSNGDDWTSALSSKEQYQVKLMKAFFNMGSWLSVHPDGPLWFRGYGTWSEEEGAAQLAEVLAAQGAEYMVVGHTIAAEKQILRLMDGKVFLIDTVEPAALEITGDEFKAIYPDGYGPIGETKPESAPGQMTPGH
jgi:hypothetical protein